MTLIKGFKKIGEPKVRKFFNIYKDYYRANSVDYDDLKQEVLLLIWQLIEKNGDKTEEDLGKYINKALTYLLTKIKLKSQKHIINLPFNSKTEQEYVSQLKNNIISYNMLLGITLLYLKRINTG